MTEEPTFGDLAAIFVGGTVGGLIAPVLLGVGLVKAVVMAPLAGSAAVCLGVMYVILRTQPDGTQS